MKIIAAGLVLSFALSTTMVAQRPSESARGGTSTQVQPKIMVIPFVKAGENLRKVVEDEFYRRLAMTKVKESFDKRGFNTVDVLQVIRDIDDDKMIQDNAQTDIKSLIIQQSRSDIYVELEVQTVQEGATRRVSMIATSRLTANAVSLANKTITVGPYNNTVPMEMIVEKAASEKMDDFLATMQSKFDAFVIEGVPIRVEFSVAKGAKDFTQLVGTDKEELGDAIEGWMQKNAYHNNYHISGRTSTHITFDEVRIPLFDPTTKANFNPSQFSLEMVRFLRTLQVRGSRSLKGGAIYVEVQ